MSTKDDQVRSFYLLDERYLKRALMILACASFVVPFVVNSGFYFPFIVPRTLVFRAIVAVMTLFYVVLVIQNPRWLPSRHWFWIIFGALGVSLTVSSVVAGTFMASFWSNYERMDGLIMLYTLWVYSMILYAVFRDKKEWHTMIVASLYFAFLMALIGLGQRFGANVILPSSGGERLTATMGNATYLAAYLLLHIFIAFYVILRKNDFANIVVIPWLSITTIALILLCELFPTSEYHGLWYRLLTSPIVGIPFMLLTASGFGCWWMRTQSWYRKSFHSIFSMVCIVVFGYIITQTQTRGAVVGLVVGLLWIAGSVALRHGEEKVIRSLAAGMLVAILVLGSLVYVFRDSPFVQSQPMLRKFASVSAQEATTRTRLVTWQASIKGIQDRPILGWGVENFSQVFNLYFPPSIYTDENTPLWYDRPHNILLQYGVEGGIVGVSIYLILLGSLCWLVIRAQRSNYIGIVLSGLIIAYTVQNLFVFDSLNSYIPFLFSLSFIAYLTTTHGRSTVWYIPRSVAMPLTLLMVIGVSVVTFIVVVLPWSTNTSFIASLRDLRSSQTKESFIDNATSALDTIERGVSLGRTELFSTLSDYVNDMIARRTMSADDFSPFVKRYASDFTKVLRDEAPYDTRMYLYLMNLFYTASVYDPAYLSRLLELGPTVRSLSPTRPQVLFLTGRAHLLQGDTAAALVDFERAVELAPWAAEPYWNLLSGLTMSTNPSDLDRASSTVSTLLTMNDFSGTFALRAARSYIAGHHYLEALALLKQASTIEPTNADLYFALMQVSAALNDNAGARHYGDRATSLNPQYANQVQQFLSQE